jgi:Fe2+ or Zn2+ uptake regulation protein
MPGHPTAAEVFVRVRGQGHPNLSLATVYRALHALVQHGEIAETRIAHVARYDALLLPHHHVVCRVCGAVADVAAEALPPQITSRLERESGFRLDTRAFFQFAGICPPAPRPEGSSPPRLHGAC